LLFEVHRFEQNDKPECHNSNTIRYL
jgi:hypothetical protein